MKNVLISVKFHCLLHFKRYIHKFFSIENADNKQGNLFKELTYSNKGGKPIKKVIFIENIALLFESTENVLNPVSNTGSLVDHRF